MAKVSKCDLDQTNLEILYDMGFSNFEVNSGLLRKYGDFNQVAEILLSGALNESAIGIVCGNGE